MLPLGRPYGTGTELCLFEFTNAGVRELLRDPDRQLDTILPKDFDGDGSAELLLRNRPEMYIQPDDIEADIGTYSPCQIYRPGNPVEIDLPLTQKYNAEHYLWVGPKYDERIKVVYPRDRSRPYIWKEEP